MGALLFFFSITPTQLVETATLFLYFCGVLICWGAQGLATSAPSDQANKSCTQSHLFFSGGHLAQNLGAVARADWFAPPKVPARGQKISGMRGKTATKKGICDMEYLQPRTATDPVQDNTDLRSGFSFAHFSSHSCISFSGGPSLASAPAHRSQGHRAHTGKNMVESHSVERGFSPKASEQGATADKAQEKR